jgi:hypothetical protein
VSTKAPIEALSEAENEYSIHYGYSLETNTILGLKIACLLKICLYLTLLGQARQFIETNGT